MNNGFGALCDEFHVSCRLFLTLDMPYERETILHFFDQIRKEYPRLTKLRRRDDGCLLLEEEADAEGSRRWIRLDSGGLRFGHNNPADRNEVRRFGDLIISQAPYHLTFSDIDFDHLEVIYGFDLEYCGNHDLLVAETLMGEQPAAAFLMDDRASHVIDAQPYFGIALTPECDLQAYVEVKSRTTTYEVRNAGYEGSPISVLLTTRKYWSVENAGSLDQGWNKLLDIADGLAADKIVPQFVNPLAAAIASRS
jgi:hypothetical protein